MMLYGQSVSLDCDFQNPLDMQKLHSESIITLTYPQSSYLHSTLPYTTQALTSLLGIKRHTFCEEVFPYHSRLN